MIPKISDPSVVLVGVCGRARSGKDTFAEVCCDLNIFFQRSFAFALKDYVADLLDVCHSDIDSAKNNDPDFRKFLIAVGQRERAKDPDYWVLKLNDYVSDKQMFNPAPNIVIPDVRFNNERDYIQINNGVLVKVVRPDREPLPCDTDESETTHLSFEPHVTILNNSTLEIFKYRCAYVADLISRGSIKRGQAIEGISIDREWQRSSEAR